MELFWITFLFSACVTRGRAFPPRNDEGYGYQNEEFMQYPIQHNPPPNLPWWDNGHSEERFVPLIDGSPIFIPPIHSTQEFNDVVPEVSFSNNRDTYHVENQMERHYPYSSVRVHSVERNGNPVNFKPSREQVKQDSEMIDSSYSDHSEVDTNSKTRNLVINVVKEVKLKNPVTERPLKVNIEQSSEINKPSVVESVNLGLEQDGEPIVVESVNVDSQKNDAVEPKIVETVNVQLENDDTDKPKVIESVKVQLDDVDKPKIVETVKVNVNEEFDNPKIVETVKVNHEQNDEMQMPKIVEVVRVGVRQNDGTANPNEAESSSKNAIDKDSNPSIVEIVTVDLIKDEKPAVVGKVTVNPVPDQDEKPAVVGKVTVNPDQDEKPAIVEKVTVNLDQEEKPIIVETVKINLDEGVDEKPVIVETVKVNLDQGEVEPINKGSTDEELMKENDFTEYDHDLPKVVDRVTSSNDEFPSSHTTNSYQLFKTSNGKTRYSSTTKIRGTRYGTKRTTRSSKSTSKTSTRTRKIRTTPAPTPSHYESKVYNYHNRFNYEKPVIVGTDYGQGYNPTVVEVIYKKDPENAGYGEAHSNKHISGGTVGLKNPNVAEGSLIRVERSTQSNQGIYLQNLNGYNKPISNTELNKMPNYDYGSEEMDLSNLDNALDIIDNTDDLVDLGSGSDDSVSARNLFPLNSNIGSLMASIQAKERANFKTCFTRKNEKGNCMPIQICTVASNLEELLSNVCAIDEIFIGICCPEFPVDRVAVDWDTVHIESEETENQNMAKNTEDCGKLPMKAEGSGWPWMAPLMSVSSGKIFCGGVLINKRYVLTAAHCTTRIPRNRIKVRLNSLDAAELSNEEFSVVEIKRHAQYDPRTMRNDIALLKIIGSVPLSDFRNAVCLPDSEELDYVGQSSQLLGWKRVVDDGKVESLTVISNQDCQNRVGIFISDSMMCASPRIEETECNIDSGAGLIADHDGKFEVIGLLTWNRNDCDNRYPSMFTRVSSYKGWIENHAV